MKFVRIVSILTLSSFLFATQAGAAIGDLSGVDCELQGGVEHCAVEIAPGAVLEGPVDAFAEHADANGFEYDDGAQRLSVRPTVAGDASGRRVPRVSCQFRGLSDVGSPHTPAHSPCAPMRTRSASSRPSKSRRGRRST